MQTHDRYPPLTTPDNWVISTTPDNVLFHCPEYDICRQEYPELFLGTNMNII